MRSLRTVRALLLCGTAAGVPLAWWARASLGLALASLLALAFAVGVMQLAPRVGLSMGLGLQVLWLLPFFACWGLGQGLGLFDRFGWWDSLAHVAGGAAIYGLFRAWVGPRLRTPRVAGVALGLLIAVGAGAAWEVGEFASDQLLGTSTQHGLTDTMGDLVFDLGGASALALALAARRIRPSLARFSADPAES